LLASLARDRKILLFLDYDGTISEITPAFAAAPPAPGAQAVLAALAARRERVSIVIVSGRTIDEVRRLLGVERNLQFAGVHGLETMDADGNRGLAFDTTQCAPDLDRIRGWLRANVEGRAGFAIEDKGVAIALHYRVADPVEADAVRTRFEAFVAREAPHLKIRRGKMVAEAIPQAASKDLAVRFFRARAAEPATPIYFGDDATDEDAFFALRDDGVTVLADGENRPSWAKYRVAGPSGVVEALAEVASELGPIPG
jgi:trehalose 6-phosphate phosphatase